ncbi:MAG: endonuclease/exonuclease/phosphatase family protein [Clostridia bacterium]|nr:endonuclease/exonuclease/phosphatase family protein [Clostridia bacterium]
MKLKIATYNIANGYWCGHDMQKLADDILAVSPDIIGLQEVDRFCKRSKYIDTVKLLSELAGYQYTHYTKNIFLEGDVAAYGQEGEYGTAVFSRYPIVSSESVMLDSANYEQRGYSKCIIDVNGEKLTFINTHLTYENTEKRKEQLVHLGKVLKNESSFFLTGDFNTESFADFDPITNAKLTNNEKTRFESFPATKVAIDNIVYSKGFNLITANTLPSTASDHIMLWAEFEKI